jgi:hypothetical protein
MISYPLNDCRRLLCHSSPLIAAPRESFRSPRRRGRRQRALFAR